MDKFLTFNNQTINIPSSTESVRGECFVQWGDNNSFPSFIKGLYQDSSLLQTIIDGIANYVSGNSVTGNISGVDYDDLITKLMTDRLTYGGFAVKIEYNPLGEIIDLGYVDFSRCRINSLGTTIYYAKHFGSRKTYSKGKIFTYPAFNSDYDGPKVSEILYYVSKKSEDFYPICPFSGSIKSIITGIEIQNFHYNSLKNNFSASGIINFNNGVPTQEEQKQIKEKLIETFTGTESASKILVAFNDSKDNAVSIERLSDDGFDEKYQSLDASVKENIFAAFRIQGILLGIPEKNKGFSKSEYSEAFELFNATQVRNYQREIVNIFNTLGDKINIEPFSLELTNEDVNSDR